MKLGFYQMKQINSMHYLEINARALNKKARGEQEEKKKQKTKRNQKTLLT